MLSMSNRVCLFRAVSRMILSPARWGRHAVLAFLLAMLLGFAPHVAQACTGERAAAATAIERNLEGSSAQPFATVLNDTEYRVALPGNSDPATGGCCGAGHAGCAWSGCSTGAAVMPFAATFEARRGFATRPVPLQDRAPSSLWDAVFRPPRFAV